MAAPFDLTLAQAVTVADALAQAQNALSLAIMDCLDEAAAVAISAVHDELRAHQRDLRSLIEAAQPATHDEVDQRGAFLIRQALGAGEPFDAIAGIAAEAFRQECALRGVPVPAVAP